MRVKKAKALSNLAEAGEGPGGGLTNSLEAYGKSHMGYVIGAVEHHTTLTH